MGMIFFTFKKVQWYLKDELIIRHNPPLPTLKNLLREPKQMSIFLTTGVSQLRWVHEAGVRGGGWG